MNAPTLDLRVQTPYELPKLKLRPLREQPAYRVARNPTACNMVELLAAVVGGAQQIEIAEELLKRFKGLTGLYRANIAEIAAVPGIGQSTAASLVASLELGKRLAMDVPEEPPTINSPADAARLVQYEMSVLDQEHLRVIVLNTRNRVLDIVEIYKGSLNSAQIRVAEIFRPAIRLNAAAIIVLHNHPSGSVDPSPDDVAVTRAIVEAGKNLDVDVLDHIIIGCAPGKRWVSLKERRLGFDSDGVRDAMHASAKRSRYQAAETIVPYNIPHRIIEALPGEYLLFPEDATEDTWHLFLDAFAMERCPTCKGKGCDPGLRPCSECGGRGSLASISPELTDKKQKGDEYVRQNAWA